WLKILRRAQSTLVNTAKTCPTAFGIFSTLNSFSHATPPIVACQCKYTHSPETSTPPPEQSSPPPEKRELIVTPKLPDFGSLPIANPSDVLRLGIVATAGFIHSPLFRWMHPHHDKYPQDTLLGYRIQMKQAVSRKDVIVLVQEDLYMPNENAMTDAIIPDNDDWEAPEPGAKVVVGVIAINLEPDHADRSWEVKDHRGDYPPLPPINPGRDLNREHYAA
ncbi:hypothetical protein QBC34DRAFT_147658, partial [Podospora aff. communis PSN243]